MCAAGVVYMCGRSSMIAFVDAREGRAVCIRSVDVGPQAFRGGTRNGGDIFPSHHFLFVFVSPLNVHTTPANFAARILFFAVFVCGWKACHPHVRAFMFYIQRSGRDRGVRETTFGGSAWQRK